MTIYTEYKKKQKNAPKRKNACSICALTAVSYTHLDVYKRQAHFTYAVFVLMFENHLILNGRLHFLSAVSYTHLQDDLQSKFYEVSQKLYQAAQAAQGAQGAQPGADPNAQQGGNDGYTCLLYTSQNERLPRLEAMLLL